MRSSTFRLWTFCVILISASMALEDKELTSEERSLSPAILVIRLVSWGSLIRADLVTTDEFVLLKLNSIVKFTTKFVISASKHSRNTFIYLSHNLICKTIAALPKNRRYSDLLIVLLYAPMLIARSNMFVTTQNNFFAGAISALLLMTILSATLGWVMHLIPHKIVFYVSTGLFAFFGLKMLYEGYHMSPNEGQEYEEAQAELQENDLGMESENRGSSDMENGRTSNNSSAWRAISMVSALFIKAFTLTFVAEWGDRSQLTTIILGASENVAGAILGGILGHSICTGIAVVGGRLLARRISVRQDTLVGGVVFLLFALSALVIEFVYSPSD